MIELKNSNVSVKCAFDDNLTNYKHNIPQLFDYNNYLITTLLYFYQMPVKLGLVDLIAFGNIWKTAIQKLNKEISQCANNNSKKEELKGYRNIMKAVEMAVVISEETGEEDKFKERDLDIKRHREHINKPMV